MFLASIPVEAWSTSTALEVTQRNQRRRQDNKKGCKESSGPYVDGRLKLSGPKDEPRLLSTVHSVPDSS